MVTVKALNRAPMKKVQSTYYSSFWISRRRL